MALIDTVVLRQALGSCAGRFDVDVLDSCTSTNQILLERAARGAPGGSVLVADRQTAGKGRRGRTWVSSPEDSLTFSVLWRTRRSLASLGGLSLAVGLAVAQGLEALKIEGIGLKWPNDILDKQGRKLGGILLELASDARGSQVVIGIGLNLRAPAVELPGGVAAGLADISPALPERHQLLAALLCSLSPVLDAFEANGFRPFQASWHQYHIWQNLAVCLLEENGKVLAEGICQGVDAEGVLLLETATGVRRFMAGDVSLRPQ